MIEVTKQEKSMKVTYNTAELREALGELIFGISPSAPGGREGENDA